MAGKLLILKQMPPRAIQKLLDKRITQRYSTNRVSIFATQIEKAATLCVAFNSNLNEELQKMKTNVATYYTIGTGENEELLRENKYQSLVEEATKSGAQAPSPTKVQSFGLPEAETDADIAELCPSEEIRVSLFNRAASLKMLNDIRDKMLNDEAFQPIDGVFDLTSVINEPTERRAASPESKIEKLLSGLSEDAVARIMQKILEKQTSPTA